MNDDVMLIRYTPTRNRTFHTHGIPFRTERSEYQATAVRVKTWRRSRPILARAYRDMRAFGMGPLQARCVVVDLLLVQR